MSKTFEQNSVIINATNIGFKFQGLGVYSLNLLIELVKLETSLNFIVYLNKTAKPHIDKIFFPENFSIRWVSERISPDNKFKGHFLRLLYSNWISFKHRNVLQFNTSQLEINFFRKNQIVTIHDVIPILFRQHHKKQYYFYKLLLGFGLRKAKYVLTPSNHSKELLQKIYAIKNEQIKVIYNGADNSCKHLKIPQLNKKNYIMYVGRICEMKNISSLIKAFEKIAAAFPHRLIVIGDDEVRFNQELSGYSPAVTSRITFKQDVCEDEKNELLSKASLLVFPSLYEGFGLPPIEAMACGCPVIVSDNSSLPEICGDAAIYVNPYCIDSIANGIKKVLSDEIKMIEMVYKSLERAKRFKWHYSAIEHLQVFDEVINFERLPETTLVPDFSIMASGRVGKIVSNL
jgi:glycosyltransferase involved in cell wall biosynthesis